MRALHFEVVGAAGGQGTTTVATVLAALAAGHRHTFLSATRPDDVAALAGTPAGAWPMAVAPGLDLVGTGAAPVADAAVVVEDLGRLSDLDGARLDVGSADTRRWLVVRGPCYGSLRTAVEHAWRPDGVVLVAEEGRSLDATDVSAVLGVEVVATVPVDAGVARSIDAGLLVAHLPRLRPLRDLARLVAVDLGRIRRPVGPAPARPAGAVVTPAGLAPRPQLFEPVRAEGEPPVQECADPLAEPGRPRPVQHRPRPRRRL